MRTIELPGKQSQSADSLALAGMISAALQEGGDIVKQLLQTAMTNPLMGIVVSIVVLDLLHKPKYDSSGKAIPNSGVLSDSAYNWAMGLIVAAGGIDLAGSVITDIAQFIPSLRFTAAQPALVQPTTQVLVLGNTGTDQLNALLSKLASKT